MYEWPEKGYRPSSCEKEDTSGCSPPVHACFTRFYIPVNFLVVSLLERKHKGLEIPDHANRWPNNDVGKADHKIVAVLENMHAHLILFEFCVNCVSQLTFRTIGPRPSPSVFCVISDR
jgi:hypothetical protein